MTVVNSSPVDDALLNSLRALLELLIAKFGPTGTILLALAILAVLFVVRWYKDRRIDKAIEKALEEKERSLQRVANQERTWRRVFLLKGVKLEPKEVDRIMLLEGDYRDPKSARAAVEKRTK